MTDLINHPPHYTSHKSGVECLTITRHMGFNLGNAVKYLWRCELKHANPVFDMKKALFYIDDAINNMDQANGLDGIPIGYALRDKPIGPSKNDWNAAGEKAVNNSNRILRDSFLNTGEIRGEVCSPDGSGDFCGGVPSGDGSLALERDKWGQSAGESELRKQEEKPRKEGGSQNGLFRSAESCCQVDLEGCWGNQNVRQDGDTIGGSIQRDAGVYRSHQARGSVESEIDRIASFFQSPIREVIPIIWRADLKGAALDDLRKAAFYIADEIKRREEAATGDEGKKLVWAVTDKSGPVFQGKPRHYPANQPPERK